MVEFGEQLKRAREEKGMTQQSLAEQLYVTRQSVSRWECGDRYPDLLTTKKISQILEVSLDDLLSGEEMEKVVERNPVIENKVANNIMIALYAFIVLSYGTSIMDIFIRFPLQSDAIGYSDIYLTGIHVLALLIQIVFFTYGFWQAIKGTLSPKRMGAVIVAYFGAICLSSSVNLAGCTRWQILLVIILLLIPRILGAVAAFFYYICGKNRKVYPVVICFTAIFGMARLVFSYGQIIRHAGQFLALNNTLRLWVELAIDGLILYQTYTFSIVLQILQSVPEINLRNFLINNTLKMPYYPQK